MPPLNESVFTITSFTLLIFICCSLLLSSLLRDKSDIYLVYLLMSASVLLVSSLNDYLTDIAHLYFMLYLYLVTIFSNNLYLLTLNIFIFVVICLSRKYYNKCVLYRSHQGESTFKLINDSINTLGTIEQGNILFCGTILLLLLKVSTL